MYCTACEQISRLENNEKYNEMLHEIPKYINNSKLYLDQMDQCEAEILNSTKPLIKKIDDQLDVNFDDSLNLVIQNAESELKDMIFLMYGNAKQLDAQIGSMKGDDTVRINQMLMVSYTFLAFFSSFYARECTVGSPHWGRNIFLQLFYISCIISNNLQAYSFNNLQRLQAIIMHS